MRAKILFAAALAAIAGASFATPRAALAHGQTVTMGGSYMAGTIVVRTRERQLYYVLGGGQAIRYPAAVVPGGSPSNPMGVAAMTLSGTEYAIHGTNAPGTIGGYVSHGCIRMFNEDITDLFHRVGVGTQVVVQ